MIKQFIETPQEMAAYLTDNAYLQRFYEIYLTIKEETERKQFEKMFWIEVGLLPLSEQAVIKDAHSKIPQRLYDRMGSIMVSVQKVLKNPVAV